MDQKVAPLHPFSSTENPTALAIQAAIQSIITEGTRYAVELKASDKLIDRNAELLKQDPSNKTLKSDQARKISTRDLCLSQIKDLSSRISNQLYQTILQDFSQSALKPQLKNSASDDRPPEPPQVFLSSLHERFELLENQVLKNQQGLEKTCHDQQHHIELLELQINSQNEEISRLKNMIQTSLAPPENLQIENDNKKTTIKNSSVPLELEEVKRDVRAMTKHFDQLQLKVITILTKEIPVNLQRSVRLIQQDVDSAIRSTLINGHKQITELLQDLVSDYEKRLSTLERLASRATVLPDPSDSSQPIPFLANPSLNPTIPTSSSSKDPRILRRQSGLNSVPLNSKLPSGNEADCLQQ